MGFMLSYPFARKRRQPVPRHPMGHGSLCARKRFGRKEPGLKTYAPSGKNRRRRKKAVLQV